MIALFKLEPICLNLFGMLKANYDSSLLQAFPSQIARDAHVPPTVNYLGKMCRPPLPLARHNYVHDGFSSHKKLAPPHIHNFPSLLDSWVGRKPQWPTWYHRLECFRQPSTSFRITIRKTESPNGPAWVEFTRFPPAPRPPAPAPGSVESLETHPPNPGENGH